MNDDLSKTLKHKLQQEDRLFCVDCNVIQPSKEFKVIFRKRHDGHTILEPEDRKAFGG